MILCLDVGNSQIYGGLFIKGKLEFQFRKPTVSSISSDELGVFLMSVIKENGFDPNIIKEIAYCSVVPDVIHAIKNCCKRYFDIVPFSVEPGAKCGLKIRYTNPLEVGPDRIATAIAAVSRHPNKNIIVADFGTATTFCAITKDKDYLGGAIVAGVKISMKALESNTARLPTVEIVNPKRACGKSTIENIQNGLYYGHLGCVKEFVERLTQECFNNEKPVVIGTGGLSGLFKDEKIFTEIVPDLVLMGIYNSLQMNS